MDFEEFHARSKELDSLDFSIMLDEWGDFNAVESNFSDMLLENKKQSAAIALQLRKIHRKGIYSETTWGMFAKLAVQHLPSQSYGAVLEKMYLTELSLVKVPSSEERGDFFHPVTKEYTEFKVSAADEAQGRNVNFVQIRPHHKIDNYHLVIVDKLTGVSEFFQLSTTQMKKEVELTGNSLAHGSKLTNVNENKEFAVRFSAVDSDAVYARWKTEYLKPFPIV
jgi:hypothetical protein